MFSLVLAWVFATYYGFVPHSIDVHAILIQYSKLSIDVNISVDGYLTHRIWSETPTED